MTDLADPNGLSVLSVLSDKLVRAVSDAHSHPQAISQLKEILTRAREEVSSHTSNCSACGNCCDFASAGHRLFATTLELALLLEHPPDGANEIQPLRCPYQKENLCTARDRRPLGCGIFFCRASTELPAAAYERYHAEIQILHTQHDIPYFYAELTESVANILASA